MTGCSKVGGFEKCVVDLRPPEAGMCFRWPVHCDAELLGVCNMSGWRSGGFTAFEVAGSETEGVQAGKIQDDAQ